jgi:peptidoglycan/LPS O-acetylase OafA/YrhL
MQDAADPTQPTVRPIKLSFIEGLRGILALYVVAHHIWGGTFSRPGASWWLGNGLAYGHLAVLAFIVLSGYCLMPTPPDSPGGPNNIRLRGGVRGFARRRARRILPPLYASMGLVAVCIAAMEYRVTHRIVFPPTAFRDPTTLGANLLLLQDVLPERNSFNGVYWSIALEAKLYLLFPALLAVYRWGGRLPTLGLAAAAGYALTLVLMRAHPLGGLYLSCPWFLLPFAMGMCARTLVLADDGEARRGKPPRETKRGPRDPSTDRIPWLASAFTALLLALLTVFPLPEMTAPQDAHSTAAGALARTALLADPVAGACAALWLVVMHRRAAREGRPCFALQALSTRPLVWLGRISYSVYLTHMVALVLVGMLMVRFLGSDPPFALMLSAGLSGAVLVGYAFFTIFEEPFHPASAASTGKQE